jgi:hypothetical protein
MQINPGIGPTLSGGNGETQIAPALARGRQLILCHDLGHGRIDKGNTADDDSYKL